MLLIKYLNVVFGQFYIVYGRMQHYDHIIFGYLFGLTLNIVPVFGFIMITFFLGINLVDFSIQRV